MRNTQDAQPVLYSDAGYLEVHSVYLSIQGEGPFAGTPATFVRLHGCNLRCPACDVDYASKKLKVHPQYVVDKVKESETRRSHLVVITGGEPFRQNIAPVIRMLLAEGYRVQVETNGTMFNPYIPYADITVVCSPKSPGLHPKLVPHIDALKYVIHADLMGRDGLPKEVLGHSARPVVARPPADFPGTIYVTPLDSGNAMQNRRHTAAAIACAMRYGHTLGIQLHKVLNLE